MHGWSMRKQTWAAGAKAKQRQATFGKVEKWKSGKVEKLPLAFEGYIYIHIHIYIYTYIYIYI